MIAQGEHAALPVAPIVQALNPNPPLPGKEVALEATTEVA
jgi:hypothetical protein